MFLHGWYSNKVWDGPFQHVQVILFYFQHGSIWFYSISNMVLFYFQHEQVILFYSNCVKKCEECENKIFPTCTGGCSQKKH